MADTRDNSGTLGTNRRRQNDRQPTHSGRCVIEGKAFWVDAWVKEGRDGRFFSLAFKPRETNTQRTDEAQERRSSTQPPRGAGEEFDDDIPF